MPFFLLPPRCEIPCSRGYGSCVLAVQLVLVGCGSRTGLFELRTDEITRVEAGPKPVETDSARPPAPDPSCPGAIAARTDPALPRPIVLARTDGNVFDLTMDGEYVYFTGSSAIHRIRRAGSPLETLASGFENLGPLVGDDDWLYFVDQTVRGGVYRVAKDGTKLKRLAPHAQVSAFCLAIDDGFIYWTSLEDGNVARMPKSGPPVEVPAKGYGAPQGISVNADSAFWVDYLSGAVWRVAKTGGEPTALLQVGETTFPRATIPDCKHLYVSIGNYGDAVVRIPLLGGPKEPFAGVGGNLAIDAAHLFVAGPNALSKVSIVDKTAIVVSTIDVGPRGGSSGIALDETDVYFVGDFGVKKASK